jgi:phosphatidylserine/phosphatidylglycerophosphate/cardiolipin synthase-like enzyme
MRSVRRGPAWAAILLVLQIPVEGTAPPAFARAAEFEVVTSIPVETSIARAGTRDAAAVWTEMIAGARRTLDMAEFYLASRKGEALEAVVGAVLDAGRRGVKVRLLCERSMAAAYPATMARFRGRPNVLLRIFDWKKLTGGVLHAKYFIVDGREAFIGSQNFDWRSLAHIQETGLRIRRAALAAALGRIFEADWDYSGGDRRAYRDLALLPPARFPADAFLVASPERFNPPGVATALATLLRLIDGARRAITVQLLTYSIEGDARHEKFAAIDQALRRAAGRGVSVRLLVSDWNLRSPGLKGLQALARVPNVGIKFVVIPQERRGFIPYARVIHSKVMRVDGDISWVGTSNWGYDYFFRSRNVEVVLRRPEIARVLDVIFLSLWNGPYARRLDPGKEYHAPRIN